MEGVNSSVAEQVGRQRAGHELPGEQEADLRRLAVVEAGEANALLRGGEPLEERLVDVPGAERGRVRAAAGLVDPGDAAVGDPPRRGVHVHGVVLPVGAGEEPLPERRQRQVPPREEHERHLGHPPDAGPPRHDAAHSSSSSLMLCHALAGASLHRSSPAAAASFAVVRRTSVGEDGGGDEQRAEELGRERRPGGRRRGPRGGAVLAISGGGVDHHHSLHAADQQRKRWKKFCFFFRESSQLACYRRKFQAFICFFYLSISKEKEGESKL
jgi:hypothetical protein